MLETQRVCLANKAAVPKLVSTLLRLSSNNKPPTPRRLQDMKSSSSSPLPSPSPSPSVGRWWTQPLQRLRAFGAAPENRMESSNCSSYGITQMLTQERGSLKKSPSIASVSCSTCIFLRAGFNLRTALRQRRLVQQAKSEKAPAVLVQERIRRKRLPKSDPNPKSQKSMPELLLLVERCKNLPSFVFPCTCTGLGSSDTGFEETFEVLFACPFTLSRASIIQSLQESGFSVICARVLHNCGQTLGMAIVYSTQNHPVLAGAIQKIIWDAFKSEPALIPEKDIDLDDSTTSTDCNRVSEDSRISEESSYGNPTPVSCPEDGLLEDYSASRQRHSTTSELDISSTSDLLHILMDNKEGQNNEALGTWLIDKDKLEIGDLIAHGSSGVIYRGAYCGQKVAVKVLKGFRKGCRAVEGEFRREVLGLISCAHKNVLKFYGICIDPRYGVCIVTKFMEGGSLQQYIQECQKLQSNEIIRLALDIAEGMRFLHSQGIVHMDLKSPNVFLDVDKGDKKIAVIGDLGVSRQLQERKANQEIGSYRWMAPEVFGSDSDASDLMITPKSDVYSFGIVLWELVTCSMPYADYTPLQAAAGVVMHGLRPIIPSDCYPPLKYLMEKCWAQIPCDRPDFSHVVSMLRIILKNV